MLTRLLFAVLAALWTVASASPVPAEHSHSSMTAGIAAVGVAADGSAQPSATAVEVTTNEATPTADPAVGTETPTPSAGATPPLGMTSSAVGPSTTETPTQPGNLSTIAVPLQSDVAAQADSAALISQAMAALNSLKQLESQKPTNCAPPATINSINSIPVDNNGMETVLNVTIGDGTTRFTPAIIKARPGDTITFNWVGMNNHSVTESDALGSCTKSTSPTAFDSGVQPPGTTWTLTIPSDASGLKFFYCKVGKHCAGTGMSGAIITSA